MDHEILQRFIDDINADTDPDKEHAFSQVISISRGLLDVYGEVCVRQLVSAGMEHFGFPDGISFRDQIVVNRSVRDIQPILKEFNISIRTH